MKFWSLPLILLFSFPNKMSSNSITDVHTEMKTLRAEINELHEKSARLLNNFMFVQSKKRQIEQMAKILREEKENDEKEKLLVAEMPINMWSTTNSDSELVIFKPNNLAAQHRGIKTSYRLLFAAFPLNLHKAYFELRIIEKQRDNGIGTIGYGLWANKENKYYQYWNNGIIIGISFGIIGGFPAFGRGDTVGCGVNMTSKKLFFTKNGIQLNTTEFDVSEAELVPFVGLLTPGDIIKANFGPNFVFNL